MLYFSSAMVDSGNSPISIIVNSHYWAVWPQSRIQYMMYISIIWNTLKSTSEIQGPGDWWYWDKVLTQHDFWQVLISIVDIMTKWKTSIRTSQTVWRVQKITSLCRNAAFDTSKRQHWCHIDIQNLKRIYSLISRWQCNIHILSSPGYCCISVRFKLIFELDYIVYIPSLATFVRVFSG